MKEHLDTIVPHSFVKKIGVKFAAKTGENFQESFFYLVFGE